LLYSLDSKAFISFYSCVSGYLILLVVLIFEKKAIEYVDEIENTYKFKDTENVDELEEENKVL